MRVIIKIARNTIVVCEQCSGVFTKVFIIKRGKTQQLSLFDKKILIRMDEGGLLLTCQYKFEVELRAKGAAPTWLDAFVIRSSCEGKHELDNITVKSNHGAIEINFNNDVTKYTGCFLS